MEVLWQDGGGSTHATNEDAEFVRWIVSAWQIGGGGRQAEASVDIRRGGIEGGRLGAGEMRLGAGERKGARIPVSSVSLVSEGVGLCWAWQANWRQWKSNLTNIYFFNIDDKNLETTFFLCVSYNVYKCDILVTLDPHFFASQILFFMTIRIR